MNRHSLVVRLTAISSLIIILTVLFLSSVVYYGLYNKIQQQIEQNLSDQANFQANKVQNLLNFEQMNLLAWRTSNVMLDIAVDDLDKRIQNELLNLKKNYQLTGDLYAFNSLGILVASSVPIPLDSKLPEKWRINDKRIHFIKPHTVKFLKKNLTITAFVVKLPIPGMSEHGTLVLTHPWKDIWQQLLSKDYQFAFYYPALKRLDLIYTEGISSQSITENFTAQRKWNFNDLSYLGKLSEPHHLDDFFFQIAAFVPENKVNQAKLAVLQQLNIAACIVIVPIILLAMLLSHRFIAPIKKLTNAIRSIENSNDLSLSVSINTKDEVADLAKAFNRMMNHLSFAFSEREKVSRELEDLNQNLEKKVQQRTEELSNTLEKLKSAQIQLVQSEKMTSLGQLVAGVAHEINNPIGAIYANVQPLKDYTVDLQEAVSKAEQLLCDDELAQFNAFLKGIDYDFMQEDLLNLLSSQQQAAQRIKKIVLSLRNFSRLDQGEVKTVLLEEGIDSTLQLLHHEYKHHIVIEKDYQLNKPVECYAGELNQVFMNILANAMQAITEKGMVKISTQLDNNNAVIVISDSGMGIPEELKTRIFEPFFTTKEIGKGTGLGLSISYGIIQKHQGTLSVSSTPNQGTTFTICIPLLLEKT
ncbi:MAG: ATP-binding protein [Methylococcales bacterium]